MAQRKKLHTIGKNVILPAVVDIIITVLGESNTK
jgi:hypothetical protein